VLGPETASEVGRDSGSDLAAEDVADYRADSHHTTSKIHAHDRDVTFTCHRRSSRGVNDPQGQREDASRVQGRGRSRHGSLRQLLAVAPDGRQRAPPDRRSAHVAVVALPVAAVSVLGPLEGVALNVSVWIGTTSKP